MGFRVYISVFGMGLGHASRMALVAKRLKEAGVEITLASFSEAYSYIVKSGFPCYKVPSFDIGWMPNAGFSFRFTFIRTPTMIKALVKQMRAEARNLVKFKPDCVISDSRLTSILMAEVLGLPCFTVLNQLKIISPAARNRLLMKLLEDGNAELLSKLWSMSKEILVPDLPPPFTISEETLWGVRSARKTRYVGFAVPRLKIDEDSLRHTYSTLELPKRKPLVFAQISGPAPTKSIMVEIVKKVVEQYGDQFTFVVSLGEADGSIKPLRIKGGWLYEWCPVKDELLSLADLIVIRGGHSTIAGAINFGKPMLLIPIHRHSEQLANAKKVARLGAGIMLDQEHLTTDDFGTALKKLVNDDSYKRSVEKLKAISLRMDGVEEIASAALSVAGSNM